MCVCVCVCVLRVITTSSSDIQPQWAAWLILMHLIRKLTISRVNSDNAGNCCHWLLLTDEFIKTEEHGCWTETFLPELTTTKTSNRTSRPVSHSLVWLHLDLHTVRRVIKLQLFHEATLIAEWNRGFWEGRLITVTTWKLKCQQWRRVCVRVRVCSKNLTWASAGSFDSVQV